MEGARIMWFVTKTIEFRKRVPELTVEFHVGCMSEELFISMPDNTFYVFSTSTFTKTYVNGNIKHFHDPNLNMGEAFLTGLEMGQFKEESDAETIYGACSSGTS